MIKRSFIPFIAVTLLIIGWFFILWNVYQKGRVKEAIIYAHIPEETIRFIDGLIETIDQYLIFDPDPQLSDWDNDDNYGETDEDGLSKIEDDYFIIYYTPTKEEKERAQKVRDWAHQAITPLAELMGKYFYPQDVKGRKLPIYLADTQKKYTKIIGYLFGNPAIEEQTGSWGMYICTYSVQGCLTKGIVMHPDTWRTDKDAKATLWHEMNHYVFYTSLDYSKVIDPYLWVSEGLAEFFSKELPVLSTNTLKRLQNERLNHTFTYVSDNYQGGQYIYCSIQKNYGMSKMKDFIRTIYSNKMENVYHKALDTSERMVEQQWKQYMDALH